MSKIAGIWFGTSTCVDSEICTYPVVGGSVNGISMDLSAKLGSLFSGFF